ncbi:MAG TPA: hypothetical protein ENH95_03605 [Nitrosopumilus sp.]|nr:hypothetical protein [Nitrosopumilus sp.]
MAKKLTNNTKMIIILSIAAILIVFSTNVLPDLIDEKPTTASDEYRYETTFPVGRPSGSNINEENPAP